LGVIARLGDNAAIILRHPASMSAALHASRSSLTLRTWLLPLVLALLGVGLALGGDDAALGLRYERGGIVGGEWWRLFSGHLVHLGWAHLGLNLAGLVVIWLLVGERMAGAIGWVAMLVCVAGVAAGLWWLNPETVWYVGLSGALHGLLVFGAVLALAGRDPIGGILLLLVLGKLAYEQFLGPSDQTERLISGRVVVDAHLYGAEAGLALAGIRVLMLRVSRA
jgi:rhomboid family GlyGly-CTERM serine protease